MTECGSSKRSQLGAMQLALAPFSSSLTGQLAGGKASFDMLLCA